MSNFSKDSLTDSCPSRLPRFSPLEKSKKAGISRKVFNDKLNDRNNRGFDFLWKCLSEQERPLDQGIVSISLVRRRRRMRLAGLFAVTAVAAVAGASTVSARPRPRGAAVPRRGLGLGDFHTSAKLAYVGEARLLNVASARTSHVIASRVLRTAGVSLLQIIA